MPDRMSPIQSLHSCGPHGLPLWRIPVEGEGPPRVCEGTPRSALEAFAVCRRADGLAVEITSRAPGLPYILGRLCPTRWKVCVRSKKPRRMVARFVFDATLDVWALRRRALLAAALLDDWLPRSLAVYVASHLDADATVRIGQKDIALAIPAAAPFVTQPAFIRDSFLLLEEEGLLRILPASPGVPTAYRWRFDPRDDDMEDCHANR